MKLFVLVSLLAVPALSAWFSGEGKFVYSHDIAFLSYANEAECRADAGRWEKDALCVFPATDDVEVKREGFNYTLRVSTVTTNAHMCDFEGKAEFQNDGSLRATAETDVWDAEKESWRPGSCVVTLRYLNGDTVGVTAGSECQSFCGMRASLEIESAKRLP